eukprot:scaffold140797_cov46-Cyclotella_meneghiniana.AAC.1
MLQQFSRTLGAMVVRGMANHNKLSRLHYVRATAKEAKFTAEANHSNNRWKTGQQRRRSSSWYSSHTSEGYATYEFMNNSVMETTSANLGECCKIYLRWKQ